MSLQVVEVAQFPMGQDGPEKARSAGPKVREDPQVRNQNDCGPYGKSEGKASDVRPFSGIAPTAARSRGTKTVPLPPSLSQPWGSLTSMGSSSKASLVR